MTKKLIDVHAYIGEGSEAEIAVKQIKRMQDNGIKLKKFYGDGAYDANEVFYAIEDAESAIMIRKNGSTCCRGNRRRREEIRKYFSLRYKAWSKITKYGLRWAVEGTFSAVKRKFGEDLKSRTVIGLLAEAMQKFWAYDEMMAFARKAVGL